MVEKKAEKVTKKATKTLKRGNNALDEIAASSKKMREDVSLLTANASSAIQTIQPQIENVTRETAHTVNAWGNVATTTNTAIGNLAPQAQATMSAATETVNALGRVATTTDAAVGNIAPQVQTAVTATANAAGAVERVAASADGAIRETNVAASNLLRTANNALSQGSTNLINLIGLLGKQSETVSNSIAKLIDTLNKHVDGLGALLKINGIIITGVVALKALRDFHQAYVEIKEDAELYRETLRNIISGTTHLMTWLKNKFNTACNLIGRSVHSLFYHQLAVPLSNLQAATATPNNGIGPHL